jgi:hypothetical protein
VLEWRNTHVNPRSGAEFLRPAPVSVVACAGEHDRALLESMGNRAIATGLPRLASCRPLPPADATTVLVATARNPYFSAGERERLLRGLTIVRDACDARSVAVRWRLTGDLANALGVPADRAPLDNALAASSVVLTTPSSLALEAMLAGRPTGLLHPFDAPLWPLAGVAAMEDGDIGETLDALLSGGDHLLARQAHALAEMASDPAEAADRLVELLTDVAHLRLEPAAASLPITERLAPVMTPPGGNRIVLCVEVAGDTPSDHARQAARILEDNASRDVHVLVIATTPHSPYDAGLDGALAESGLTLDDPRVSVCVIDPVQSTFAGGAIVRASLCATGARTVAHWSTPFARSGATDWPAIDLEQHDSLDAQFSVPVAPTPEAFALDCALHMAFDRRARRLAICPAGRRAHRCIRVIEAFERDTGLRIALLDDSALPEDAEAARPIHTLAEGALFPPDAVILCADGNAKPWADRCKGISDAGAMVLSACDDAISPEPAHVLID